MCTKTVKFLVLLVSPLFMSFPSYPDSPGRALTLAESVRIGILNNTELMLAKTDIDMIREKASEAGSGKYPQLEAYAGYTRAKVDTLTSILPGDFGDLLMNNAQNDYYHMRVTLQQVLFAGTKFSNARQLANAAMNRQQKEYEVIKNQAVRRIKKTYYECLYYHSLIEEYNSILSGINESGKQDSALKIFVDDLENLKENALAELDISLLNLKYVVGIELGTECRLTDSFAVTEIDYDLEIMMGLAKRFRPELNISETQEEMDLLAVKLYQSEKYPVISVGGSYEYLTNEITYKKEDWITNWSTTLNLSLPIFDGGAWISRLKQKNIQYRKTKLNRSAIQDRVLFEVRSAFLACKRYLPGYLEGKEKKMSYDLRLSNAVTGLKKGTTTSAEFARISAEYLGFISINYITIKDYCSLIADLEAAVGLEF